MTWLFIFVFLLLTLSYSSKIIATNLITGVCVIIVIAEAIVAAVLWVRYGRKEMLDSKFKIPDSRANPDSKDNSEDDSQGTLHE